MGTDVTTAEVVRLVEEFESVLEAGQFLRVPSCSIDNAFSTLSVPDAWLGGYSVKVARNSPTMVIAGTIVQSF